MKKLFYALAAALLLLASCTESGGKYKVVVTVAGDVAEGDTVLLTSYDSGDTVASAVVSNRAAVLEGSTAESFMARLLVGGKRVGFVVEPGEISITSEGVAGGSPLNDCLNAIEARLDSAGDEQQEMAIFREAYEANRDNGIGPWAFNYYLMYNQFTVAQIDSLLAAAPKGYDKLVRVQKARQAAKQLEVTAVGQKFADFAAPDGQKLSDYAGRGKYTLVDFWSSWCGPCRREIPNIKALYDKYKDKMNFVGIAVWDDPADTKQAIQQLGIVWQVLEGGKNWKEPTDLYGISGIPHIMLIDPEGVIVARGLEGEAMKKAVDDVMK